MSRLFLGVFLLLSGLALANPLYAAGKMITVADIHFDPFYDCETSDKLCPLVQKLATEDPQNWEEVFKQENESSPSPYYKNTNFSLWQSTLDALQELNEKEHPQFVLVLGDFLAHGFRAHYKKYTGDTSEEGYENFVKKTYQFMMDQLNENLPDVDIYSVVGNNDSYTGDYGVSPKGKYFKDIGSIWAEGITDPANKNSFNQDFYTGGYYSVLVPNSQDRVIVLNSTLFSSLVVGKKIKHAAEQQLDWLNDQLTLAERNHQPVILAFHIPLGIDVYKTFKSKPISLIQNFWKQSYAQKFQDILTAHPTTVKAILPGHIHSDIFQLFSINKVTDIPVTFTPSISPIYANNPGFKIFEYDPTTFDLLNFDVYYYPLNKNDGHWYREYNFNRIFQSECEHCTLLPGLKALFSSNNMDPYFEKFVHVNVPQQFSKTEMTYYKCGVNNFSYEQYKSCVADDSILLKIPGVAYATQLWQNIHFPRLNLGSSFEMYYQELKRRL